MLRRITLHLARNAAFPDGSADHGYEIVVPLDATGHIDHAAWQKVRGQCQVRRFWAGLPDRHGLLTHHAGGAGGGTWVLDYDKSSAEDDEAGYRLDEHLFRVGEYISLAGKDDHIHTYKVVDIK